MPNGHRVLVAGLGNIGSNSALLVSRLPSVARLLLIDFDRVDERNVSTQAVRRSDVGRPKAAVIEEMVRAVRPDIDVVAHSKRIEDVPLGGLRADIALGCLDSRAARMAMNERLVALGVAVVDAGVSAAGHLVRTSVHGPAGPCLECGWDEAAYSTAESVYACDGTLANPVSTGAPAYLGAAAAALQVAACDALLRGERGALGTETIVDLHHRRLFVSTVRAREDCRLAPHRPKEIEPLDRSPRALPLEAAALLGSAPTSAGGCSIRVARGPFATRLRCADCGTERAVLRLVSSLTPRDRVCRICGASMVFGGMDLVDELSLDALTRDERKRSLATLGVGTGDVITIRTGEAARHFEIVTPASIDGDGEEAR